MSSEQEPAMGSTAARVVVAYPPDMGESGLAFLERKSFRNYLARAWDAVEPGTEFQEMVNLGCCSDATTVPLTVESVEGGPRMGLDTEIEFVEGDDPAGLGCDW